MSITEMDGNNPAAVHLSRQLSNAARALDALGDVHYLADVQQQDVRRRQKADEAVEALRGVRADVDRFLSRAQ